MQMFMKRAGSDERHFTGVDVEDQSIRLPWALLNRLANGGNVTVTSSFYRNMSGLLPGNLETGAGYVPASHSTCHTPPHAQTHTHTHTHTHIHTPTHTHTHRFELASPVLSTSLQCGTEACEMGEVDPSEPFIITITHSENIAVSYQ